MRTYTGLLASLLPGTGERVHDSAVVLLQWAIQVLGMVEKVSRNQAYHAREAATIVPQVKDHGIGIIQFAMSAEAVAWHTDVSGNALSLR
ncbi:MAG: hypothetical protein WCA27_25480 [Candidatus Sulfotelmatobacter sp.]